MNFKKENLKEKAAAVQDASDVMDFLKVLTNQECEVVFNTLKEKICWSFDNNRDTYNVIKFINTQHSTLEH